MRMSEEHFSGNVDGNPAGTSNSEVSSLELLGPIYLSIYLSIYISIYLPIYLSIYLSIYLYMYRAYEGLEF